MNFKLKTKKAQELEANAAKWLEIENALTQGNSKPSPQSIIKALSQEEEENEEDSTEIEIAEEAEEVIESLEDKIDRLEKENEDLKAENEELKAENEELKAENERLKEENDDLKDLPAEEPATVSTKKELKKSQSLALKFQSLNGNPNAILAEAKKAGLI